MVFEGCRAFLEWFLRDEESHFAGVFRAHLGIPKCFLGSFLGTLNFGNG